MRARGRQLRCQLSRHVELCICSALARVGKKVLQLDGVRPRFLILSFAMLPVSPFLSSPTQNDYYGSQDGSFTLTGLLEWAAAQAPSPFAQFGIASTTPPLPPYLLSLSRRFSLDINPRLVLSRGVMVDLLVSSETSHYLDFKTTEGLYSLFDSTPKDDGVSTDARIMKVPASKADVFKHSMNPLDKRRLMKFIQVPLSHLLLLPLLPPSSPCPFPSSLSLSSPPPPPVHSLFSRIFFARVIPMVWCPPCVPSQFCMDKHVGEAEDAASTVETVNEVTLGQGRSLTRCVPLSAWHDSALAVPHSPPLPSPPPPAGRRTSPW